MTVTYAESPHVALQCATCRESCTTPTDFRAPCALASACA